MMMTHGQSVAADLKRLIAGGRISESALHAVTGIEFGKLAALLADDSSASTGVTVHGAVLSPEESARVSTLVAQLTYGLDIDDDERLQGILESLTSVVGLTLENISRLTQLDLGDLKKALSDPADLPSEAKYMLAIRGSYLVNAANLARAR
ncbi:MULTISPECIES: HTH domain-containing protein [Microbacterium]|nr:HTH domain-containing protein [Microbacterium kyungheense]